MKKTITLILSMTLAFSVVGTFDTKVNAASYSVSTSKSTYGLGESIKVNYSGCSVSNKDWIGIYKSSTDPSEEAKDAALAWKYVTSSSGSVTFTSSDFINAQYSPEKGAMLEQGRYKAVICKNNKYEVADTDRFKIEGSNPNLIFDVYSEGHIVSGTSTNSNSSTLDNAIKDIKTFNPESSAIVFNGDSVDQADWNLYDKLRQIYYNNRADMPPVYFNLGNHELFDSSANSDYKSTSYSIKFNRFLYFSENIHYLLTGDSLESDHRDVPYYEEEIDGYPFLFIASESVNFKDKMDLSETQLNWLDNRLWHLVNDDEDRKHTPIFVFGHGAVKDTVAGSRTNQNWDGVAQDYKLKYILNKYPNVIYISGHSHWNLASPYTMYQEKATYGGGVGATFINDGALTNLWSDGGGISGSQGLNIRVYDDKIVIRGRDYSNNRWASGARYVIDLDKQYESLDNIY